MSVCFVDIDKFKEVNDRLGHDAGDLLLQQLSTTMRTTLRTPDFLARYGGEEFVIIAPGTWTEDAVILGNRLREAIAHHVDRPFGRPVTVSIGIAGVPEHGTDASSVLKRADEALYVAKRSGRDRVEISSATDALTP
jgi:diguanylate cyclase (GGDEF)-like protein